jgi:hypothetical protein
VIFLDIDGVLNALPFLEGRDGSDWSQLIDHRAVARLNTLIDRSSAKVVISSSWRCHLPIVHIESLLRAQGFAGEILGATPRRTPNRGAEIQAWIDAADEEPEALVILDDLDEMEQLTPCFVRTSFEEGLLDTHVEAALSILAQPWRALVDPPAP